MPAAHTALVIGGGIAGPVAATALTISGVDDDVRAAAIPIARSLMSIASKPGREVPGPQGLPPGQLIDRGVLHAILGERARRAGVRLSTARS